MVHLHERDGHKPHKQTTQKRYFSANSFCQVGRAKKKKKKKKEFNNKTVTIWFEMRVDTALTWQAIWNIIPNLLDFTYPSGEKTHWKREAH